MPRRIRAPAKLVLAGEYAVLTPGEPAIVAAIDRYAVLSEERGRISIDTSSFHDPASGKKLGLGSSAAVAVCRTAHRSSELDPGRLLALAREEHEAMGQRGGSGIDLAASIHGGILLYRQGYPAERIEIPVGLELVVAWTGEEARTSGMAAAVGAALAERPEARARFLEDSRRAVLGLAEALGTQDEEGLQAWMACATDALEFLASSTGVGIFTKGLERLAHAARGLDLGAKPSGAGGGDCGIALTFDRDKAAKVRDAWSHEGLVPLEIGISPTGVERVEG